MCAHSRRSFLSRLLGQSFAAAAVMDQAFWRAAQARAQSATASATLFDLEKIAPNTWAALARPAAIVNCNAVIFEGARDLMVVDTHSKPSAAAALVAQLRGQVSTKPVRYIVNTHLHGDHTQGTSIWMKESRSPDVISSRTTRRLIDEFGAKRAAASVETMRRSLEENRQKAASSSSEEEKRYYARIIPEMDTFVKEMSGYQPVLPNVTFNDDLIIHDGNQELHLVFRGRAHTAGDVCVFCPQTGVLASGDLITGMLPRMADGFPLEWPLTLDKFSELPFKIVAAGHGPVQTNRSQFNGQKNYLDEINSRVAAAVKSGQKLPEAQAAITPATLKTLEAGEYLNFVRTTIGKYSLLAPGVTVENAIATDVRGNVAAAYAAIRA